MGTSYGASKFPSLFNSCIFWFTGQHSAGVSGDIDEFPIIPTGVTVTNNGTFTKDDLGNNKSVLNFDGSTNYISLSDNDAWSFHNSNFTVSFWVKFDSISDRGINIGQYVSDTVYWYIKYDNLAQYYIIKGYNESAVMSYTRGDLPNTGTWYYITVVRSGTDCLIYINAVFNFTTVIVAFGTIPNYAAPLTIGMTSPLTAFHNGNIKDLMIFTRALSLPEIKLLMNRTHPVTGEGLIPGPYDYWRLS